MANVIKGALVEYGLSLPPLALIFQFNPETISRSRTITVTTGNAPGTRGGYDFVSPLETPRVAQGVELQRESFTIDVLFDATDALEQGDAIAQAFGIQPQIDTLKTMVEPKTQGPAGLQMLSSLGLGGARAFQRQEHASVLIFVWGIQILPVFLTSVTFNEVAHLSSLLPYRANVQLTMEVIEGSNPFYQIDKLRQLAGATLNLGQTVGSVLGGLL